MGQPEAVWGRYQASASLMMALLKMPAAWFQLSMLFLAPTVNFRCLNPLNKSSPLSNLSEYEIFDGSCYYQDQQDSLHTCHQLQYDRAVFTVTVNMMWNLVCEHEMLATFAQVSFMCGVTIGNLIGGLAAARVGRKPVLMVAVLLMPLFSAIVAVVPTFSLFLLFRFLLGLSLGGTIVISFLLGGELTSGQWQWRAPVTILHQVPFGIGQAIFGLTAYFLRDWREIQMALSAYCLIFLPYCWLIEESPMWLVASGKLNRAERVTAAIQRRNGRLLPSRTEMRPIADKQKVVIVKAESNKVTNNNCNEGEMKTLSFCGLCSVPRLRHYLLTVWITWYCAGLSFFALNAYQPQWGGGAVGAIVNVTVGGVCGIPGNIIAIFLVKRFGRKKVTIIAHLFAAIFSFLLPIYDVGEQPEDWQRRLAGICSLVAMSIAYPALFLMSGELIPNIVKLPVMTVANLMARLGNTTAPLVGPTAVFHRWMPLCIIGTAPLLSIALLLGVPETKDRPLPNTVEDILPSKRSPEMAIIPAEEDAVFHRWMPLCIIGTAPLLSIALLLGVPETKDRPLPNTVEDILPSKRSPEMAIIPAEEDVKTKIYKPLAECES